MNKLLLPFGVALGIHIIVVLLSGFFIKKEDSNLFDTRNLIDVQFASSTDLTQKIVTSENYQKTTAKNIPVKPEGASTSTAVKNSDTISNEVSGGSTSAGVGNNFETSVINYQAPVYPRGARVRGMQGNVRIHVQVSADGLPSEYNILKSSGHETLDKAALDVIPHWRFRPSAKAYSIEKNIIFQLKDN